MTQERNIPSSIVTFLAIHSDCLVGCNTTISAFFSPIFGCVHSPLLTSKEVLLVIARYAHVLALESTTVHATSNSCHATSHMLHASPSSQVKSSLLYVPLSLFHHSLPLPCQLLLLDIEHCCMGFCQHSYTHTFSLSLSIASSLSCIFGVNITPRDINKSVPRFSYCSASHQTFHLSMLAIKWNALDQGMGLFYSVQPCINY